jgi:hypothetical protein
MKMTYGKLKRLIAEAADDNALETEEPIEKEVGDSIDAQVDRYLSDYEKEARDSVQNEAVGFRTMFQDFLNEAGEEEDAESPDAALPDEDVGAMVEQPEINIESFTDSIVRLIDNYDSLLEVRDTIAKRAMNFLTKTYPKEILTAFKDQLRDQYDIELDKSEDEVQKEQNPPPPADRAGEGFGSGAGGGGV